MTVVWVCGGYCSLQLCTHTTLNHFQNGCVRDHVPSVNLPDLHRVITSPRDCAIGGGSLLHTCTTGAAVVSGRAYCST